MTMRCDNNWSLNYESKVRDRGRLIHHGGEARQAQLAAVSSAALRTREACLKLRCKVGLAARFFNDTRIGAANARRGSFFLFCFFFTLLLTSKQSYRLIPLKLLCELHYICVHQLVTVKATVTTACAHTGADSWSSSKCIKEVRSLSKKLRNGNFQPLNFN